MKFAVILMAGATLALSGPAMAGDACVRPAAPTALSGVDLAAVTMEQLVAAKKEVGDFMGASDTYQACVIEDISAQRAAAKAAKTKLDPAIEAAAKTMLDENQADKERAGAEFNAAVKAYKAAHPS